MPKDQVIKKSTAIVGAKADMIKRKTVNGFVKTGRIIGAGGRMVSNIVRNTVDKEYKKPNVQAYLTIKEANKLEKKEKRNQRKLKRQAWLEAMSAPQSTEKNKKQIVYLNLLEAKNIIMSSTIKTTKYIMSKTMYKEICKKNDKPSLTNAELVAYVNANFGLLRPVSTVSVTNNP